MQDIYWMREALKEARKSLGLSWPNPPVGAVLVKNGRCVARGATQEAGMDHAERVCLKKAGERGRGASLYVSLEPCSHHGKTTPCTDAIIQAGVKRVVIAVEDPNPKVAGQGIAILTKNGIETSLGCLSDEANRLIQPFKKHITTQIPWFVLKYAMTLDGRMALDSGDSSWISGEEARQEVQRLRSETQAILVGGNTVRKDDPFLNCRLPGVKKQPARIIPTRIGFPRDANIFQTDSPVHVLTTVAEYDLLKNGLGGQAKITCLENLKIETIAGWLGQEGFASVLIEAGPKLITEFVKARLIDRVFAFVAPAMAGGTGMQPLAEIGTPSMNQALRLKGEWRRVGLDSLFEGVIDYK